MKIRTKKQHINDLQKVVDELKISQYREYVEQHCLKLLDCSFEMIDNMLDKGTLV